MRFNGSAADQRRRGPWQVRPIRSPACFNGSAADQRRRGDLGRQAAGLGVAASTGPPLISGGGNGEVVDRTWQAPLQRVRR